MGTGSLNIAEWTPDQVYDWVSGLDAPCSQYAVSLRARRVDGARLLALTCDGLDTLGVVAVGHQELLLEALDLLRDFQYESGRECVQRLAMRVSVMATQLVRALAGGEARLGTQTLADVARVVRQVKPLCWWLRRGPFVAAPPLEARAAALLGQALQAAASAQRDRWAEDAAGAVRRAAAATAAAADYIVQDARDPAVLQPAAIDSVTLRQGDRPLGFRVLPAFGGHARLAHVRFGSPAHASGAVLEGDEIVQVGDRCVIGWSGEAVLAACRACAARGGELPLRLRRRAPPAPRPAPRPRAPPPPAAPAPSDDSDELSPPASPTAPGPPRLYPPKPRAPPQRRHSLGGVCVPADHPHLRVEQFWHELRAARWESRSGRGASPDEDDCTLYRRDKALSCSTGLERSPRPRPGPGGAEETAAERRTRLDKSHSTPAYDLGAPPGPPPPPPALSVQPIPESPTSPGDPPLPPGEPAPAAAPPLSVTEPHHPALRAMPRIDIHKEYSSLKSIRLGDRPEISLPLPQILVNTRAVNSPPPEPSPPRSAPGLSPARPAPAPFPARPAPSLAPPAAVTPTSTSSVVRGIFPSSKSRSLKKKNSLLAKRRNISARQVAAVALGAGGAWQRVRGGAAAAGGAARPRWTRRHLLLAHGVLYVFRSPEGGRAVCLARLAGCTAAEAPEVRSRAHAFKVYRPGAALYFAGDTRDHTRAWLGLLARAIADAGLTMDVTNQFSETDYSDVDTDDDTSERASERDREREREREKEREKDKSKFGSLRKFGKSRSSGEAGAASLDRRQLRLWGRRAPRAPPQPSLLTLHASNPNLLDFDKSGLAPAPPAAPAPKKRPHNNFLGFVTLEEFMLKKQEEERRQVYSNRVLMGIERSGHSARRGGAPTTPGGVSGPAGTGAGGASATNGALLERLQHIVPDVIYGELPAPAAVVAGAGAGVGKPVSVKGKDGYEKIVYPGEPEGAEASRQDKSRRRPRRGAAAVYPHLVCPPTFQPEVYCLARLAPRHPHPAHPAHDTQTHATQSQPQPQP